MYPIQTSDLLNDIYNKRGNITKSTIVSKAIKSGKITYSNYLTVMNKYRDKNNRKKSKKQLRGVRIVMDENENIEMPSSFEDLETRQKMFFTLFQSINYYDARLKSRTYLKPDVAYLVTYINPSDYDKYVVVNEDSEGFKYVDSKAASTIRVKANNVLHGKRMRKALRELTEIMLGDDEMIRQQTLMATMDIAFNTEEKSNDRLTALSKLGNWYGIEKPNTTNNTNVIVAGIDSQINDILGDLEDIE